MEDCLFCSIINGNIPSRKIYEDAHIIAILDIFPVTKGQILVIPKKHVTSSFAHTDKEALHQSIDAAYTLAKELENKLQAQRIIQIIEGLDVDHLHIKLYPDYLNSPSLTRPPERKATDAELDEVYDLLTKKS